MNLHCEMYGMILALVPKVRELRMAKESYLLQSDDQVPVNVWPDVQTIEKTDITMSCYPYDRHGNLVPSPHVEIKLFHNKAEAVPVLYMDALHDEAFVKLRRKNASDLHQELDLTVHSWLTELQRLNFRFEYPQDGHLGNSSSFDKPGV